MTKLMMQEENVPVLGPTGPLEVSIVMPCLNEAKTLAACISRARHGLAVIGVEGEIIVADNGSTDESRVIALLSGAAVVPVEVKGYGSALLGGINSARGRFIIIGDADESYDFGNLLPFIEKLRGGDELVVGNRFMGEIRPGAMPVLHRYFGNPVLSGTARLFFGSACRDFHCGLRGFNRDSILKLELRTTGMEFASEMIVKAILHGLRISEVPTTLFRDGRDRRPHLRTWRDGWRHLRFLLLYCPEWLFLYPGLLLMIVGLASGLWLIRGPRLVGSVTFDIFSLMYGAAAIIIGFNAVVFGVFAKVFAINERLVPNNLRFTRWVGHLRLEFGLVLGGVLTVFGLGMSGWAVGAWSGHAFGRLDPAREGRLVIPAVTTLILGCQTILSSFLLSILRLGRR